MNWLGHAHKCRGCHEYAHDCECEPVSEFDRARDKADMQFERGWITPREHQRLMYEIAEAEAAAEVRAA